MTRGIGRAAGPLSIAMAGAVLATSPLGSAAPAAPTGLHGFVTRGLITPVCYEDVPCVERAAGVTLTFTRADGTRVRAVTRATGFYRVALPVGGRYSVKATGGRVATLTPARVRARRGLDARLDFYIDTGIQ